MTEQAQEQPKAKSLDEIAALMAQNTMEMRGMTDEAEQPSTEDIVEDDAEEIQNTEPEQGHSAVEEADDDEQSDPEVDGDDEEDPQLGDELEDLILQDDDLVFIDDDTEMTFAELKSFATADKTIAEKAKEQSEAAIEAVRIRDQARHDSEKIVAAAKKVMELAGDNLVQELVSKPDPAQYNNMEDFRRHQQAYEQDQTRVQTAKQALLDVVEQHRKDTEEAHEQRKAEEFALLHQKVPALASQDKAVKAAASQDILDAAAFYGFSKADVDLAADHRLFQMAYDAQQYRKTLQPATKEEVTMEKKIDKARRRARTLRSGGTSAKMRQTTKARHVKSTKEAAEKRGSVENVANFIVASRNT